MMLKASPEAAIRARFEGEVAERKTFPRLFFSFGVSRPLWRYFTPKPIAVPLKNTGLWEGGAD